MFVWLIVTRLVLLVEQEVFIRPENPRLVGFWVVQSLVSWVVCRILCFQGHLYCVSLELRFLIIPLVSSNHSYVRNNFVFLFLHICDVLLCKSHFLVNKNYTMNIPSFSSQRNHNLLKLNILMLYIYIYQFCTRLKNFLATANPLQTVYCISTVTDVGLTDDYGNYSFVVVISRLFLVHDVLSGLQHT